jgi:tetratricopeptide (TPR) repeat protein
MITLGMIVRDGAKLLARVFMSVRGLADEIILVDTGSVDATIDVAREFGATVISHPWGDDFAEARNVFLDHARTDWILVLDADETLDERAHAIIRQAIDLMSDGGLPTVFYLPVRSYTSSDENVGHAMETYLPRLLPRAQKLRYEGAIHENPTFIDDSPYRTAMIPAVIHHYGYKLDEEERERKRLRNWDLIKKALARDPDNPFNLFNYGFAVFNENNFEAALEALDSAISLFGKRTQAAYFPYMLVLSAICLKNMGDLESAKMRLDHALSLHADFPDAYYVRGMIFLEEGEKEKARVELLEALSCGKRPLTYYGLRDLSTSNWKPLLELARMAFNEGGFREALGYYERALEFLPWNKLVLADIGLCHSQLGERSQALNAWNIAFPEGFVTPEGAVEYIEALAASGDGIHARKVYEEFSREFPGSFELHERAAKAFLKTERKEDARTAYERALEARPGDPLASMNLAALLVDLGLHDEAVKVLGPGERT